MKEYLTDLGAIGPSGWPLGVVCVSQPKKEKV